MYTRAAFACVAGDCPEETHGPMRVTHRPSERSPDAGAGPDADPCCPEGDASDLATRPRRTARRRMRGQSLVEFAIVVPLLLGIVGVTLDFARVYQLWMRLQAVTRDTAEFLHRLRMTTFWHTGSVAPADAPTEAFLAAYSSAVADGAYLANLRFHWARYIFHSFNHKLKDTDSNDLEVDAMVRFYRSEFEHAIASLLSRGNVERGNLIGAGQVDFAVLHVVGAAANCDPIPRIVYGPRFGRTWFDSRHQDVMRVLAGAIADDDGAGCPMAAAASTSFMASSTL